MSLTMTEISTLYRTITSTRSAIELAAELNHPERERPAVVVSTTKSGPMINPETLARRLGTGVDVYLLGSASLAYDFQDAMPLDTSVYGGAARCYPPGNGWAKSTHKSMVRLAYTPEEGRAAIALLAGDVDDMEPLAARTVSSSTPRRQAPPETVTGTVSVILEPDGVLIKLQDGIARIDTSVLAPGINPDLLFSPDQQVTGTVRDGMLTITQGLHTPADAVDRATPGTIHPALVVSHKNVLLFPGLKVRHATAEPAGSVIAVQVELQGRADGKAWKLGTVEDPDPASITEALPFLAGGEPWIRHEASADLPVPGIIPQAIPEPAADAVVDAVDPVAAEPVSVDPFAALDSVRARLEHLTADNARLSRELTDLQLEEPSRAETFPVPAPAVGGAELERLRAQVALLTRQKIDMIEDVSRANEDANSLAAENARLSQQLERVREDVRKERDRSARARQMARDIEDVAETGPLFADPEQQFRHEIYMEWATRIPAGSKTTTPLADYGFADGFLASVEDLQGVDRSKIIAVAVEVLTGLADSMPGRDMHRLRGGVAGTSTYVEDPQLGTAWRVALQVKTASARRMHFWRGTDGRIVFATVGLHDDMGI